MATCSMQHMRTHIIQTKREFYSEIWMQKQMGMIQFQLLFSVCLPQNELFWSDLHIYH